MIRRLQLTAVAIKTILHFTLGYPANRAKKQPISNISYVKPKTQSSHPYEHFANMLFLFYGGDVGN